ncbi:HTH_38 domain-containing protein [Trichonephila clavipes]|nr:HTH_38 domain-containing protein [Trichonephila clavipes]
MLLGRHRESFDQVSEFDRGRTVAYRDRGLSFTEIDQFVRQNQATVMQSCYHWIDGTSSHITNHSTTDSVCYALFGIHSYHPTPFAAEWNVRKAFFASFTLDWKP